MTFDRRPSAALAALCALVLATAVLLPLRAAMAAPVLPQRTGAVTDEADILTDADERSLTNWAGQIKQKSGTELVVVTLLSLQRQTIETWGPALGRGWQVGGSNGNGIILIIAPNDREVRIEVGDGVSSRFSDGVAAAIIRNVIIPKFKEGKLAAGTAAGVYAIADALAPNTYSLERPAQSAAWAKPQFITIGVAAILIPFVLLIVYVIFRAMRDASNRVITPEEERQQRSFNDVNALPDRDRVVQRDDDDRSSGTVFGGSRRSSGFWSLGGGSSISWGSRGSSGSWGSSSRSSSGSFGGGRSSGGGFGGGRGSSGKW